MKTRNADEDNFLETPDGKVVKTYVRELFDRVNTSRMHRYSAISGGPDSMVTTWLLLQYCIEKGISLSSCALLYFDHQQRSNTTDLISIRNTFPGITLLTDSFPKKKASEAILRKARRDFFERCISSSTNPVCLLTGHTLTDRVETTFLNLLRGCHRQGFINMRTVENKKNRFSGNTYRVLRPLLKYTKEKILETASFLGLTYSIDTTNSDSTISKRNYIRNIALPVFFKAGPNGSSKAFYTSMQELYTVLEHTEHDSVREITALQPSLYRQTDLYFCCHGPRSMATVEAFMKKVLPKKHLTKSFLQEMTTFFSVRAASRKRVHGMYFFKSHGLVYGIRHENNLFRQQYLADCQKITTLQTYNVGDFKRTIESSDLVGGSIRFPQSGDSYKKKSLSKWFIAQKIPIFRRKYIPVIEKDGSIVAVYPFSLHLGHMYCCI